MSFVNYFLMNAEIVVGENAIEALAKCLKRLNVKKPLIVTDTVLIQGEGVKILERYLEANGIEYAVYSNVREDPFDYMVTEGVEALKKNQCDGVISLGGGSTMDTGKGISIMSVHEGNIIQYGRSTPNHKNFTQAGCPLIAIPTTSGTGSEVSRYAVITNSETHQKRSIESEYILSNVVILDPVFAVTMPKRVTAYTGIDAICHAIEAYTHKTTIEQTVELSDALALKAIEIISENLVTAYQYPEDINARKNMQWGALLAGVALNIGAGEAHGIGTYLSKYFQVPHGASVGLLLPYTMEYVIPYAPERFCRIAEVMGKDISGLSTEQAARLAPAAVKELLEKLDFPTLKDYCKDFDEIKKLCSEAPHNSCCVSNGRLTEEADTEKLLKNCFDERLSI